MKRAFVLLLTLTLTARAADDPHGKTWATQCLSCHATHKAAGQSLTSAISNESLCTSCHNLGGTAARFPLERYLKADPANNLGTSHAWNVPSTNAGAGALPPQSVEMVRQGVENVLCSTCHDPHKTGTSGTQSKTSAVRVAGSGTGTVSYTATAGATGKAYLIDIIEAGGPAGVAKFRLSNDGGMSWFGYSAGAWAAYTSGTAQLTGASVALNDGANVLATFSGNFVIGDRIRFHIAYPFLRVALDSGDNVTGVKFCRDCHREMAMDHAGTNSWDGTMRSHPVGVTLNANGMGYDRAVPLDANGVAQSTGDGNASNDLQLAADQTIQCLTCHGVHHADGNSNTVDTP